MLLCWKIAGTVASVLPSLSKRSEHSTTVVRLGLSVAKDHLSPPANGPKTNAQHSTVPPVEVCLVARLHAPLSRPLVWCSSRGLFSNVLSFCFHVNSPPIRDSKETLSSPLQCNFRQCSQRVEEVERKNCPLVAQKNTLPSIIRRAKYPVHPAKRKCAKPSAPSAAAITAVVQPLPSSHPSPPSPPPHSLCRHHRRRHCHRLRHTKQPRESKPRRLHHPQPPSSPRRPRHQPPPSPTKFSRHLCMQSV